MDTKTSLLNMYHNFFFYIYNNFDACWVKNLWEWSQIGAGEAQIIMVKPKEKLSYCMAYLVV